MDNEEFHRSSPPKRNVKDEELDGPHRKMLKVAPPSPEKEEPISDDQAWNLELEIALLPNLETAALRQALQQAPELVLLEPDPSAFLEFHKGDAKEATRRLSCYWTTRVEVFGDQAFLPLSFPQKYGLLSSEHWRELECGTMVPLPDDAEGNTVIFIDRSRQVCPPDLKIRLRAAFYLLCHCCSPLKSRKGGSGVVLLFNVSARASFQSPVNEHLLKWIHSAFPVALKHVHLAGCPPAKPARKIFENGTMRTALQSLKNRHAKTITAHVGMKKKDLMEKLVPFGFREEGLPQVLGGNWDYQVFLAWVQGRDKGNSDETEGTQESKTDVHDDPQEDPQPERAQRSPTERELASLPEGHGERQAIPGGTEESKSSAEKFASTPAAQSPPPPVPLAAPQQAESSSSSEEMEDNDEEEDRKLPARTTPLFEGGRNWSAHPMQEPPTVAPAVESLLAMATAVSPHGVPGWATSTDRREMGSFLASLQSSQQLQADQQLQQELAIARLTRDSRLNLYASAPASQYGDAAFVQPEDSLRPGTGQLLGLLSSSINARPAEETQTTQDRILERTTQVLPSPGMLPPTAGSAAVLNAMNLLPLSAKKSYLEALQHCPRLVEIESDAQKFLMCTDFDVMAAAQRLASYWEFRKELFGSRAFTPLIQSGNGALTSEDVVLLSSGAMATLPPDDSGCSVVCMDRSRLLGRQAATVNDRLRAAFYLASTLSEVEKNKTDGIVLVCILITPRMLQIDDDMTLGLLELSRKAFPIKVKHIHLAACPPKTGKRAVVDNMIAGQLKLIAGGFKGRATLHVAETPEAIFEKLRPFGLREDALPPSAGGSWKYEEFNRFLRHQSEREQRLESTLMTMSGKPPAQSNEVEKIDKKERKRLLNIIHSRQKRERRRAEMERMSDERDALKTKNKQLRSNNSTLEKLIEEAEQLVEKIEKGEILADTAATSTEYGASDSMTLHPEQYPPTATLGAMATARTEIARRSTASEGTKPPPRLETAPFSALQQPPQQLRPLTLEQVDPMFLSHQMQPSPQESQSALLARLWAESRTRGIAPGLHTGTQNTSLPSYQGRSLSSPESSLLRATLVSELEQRLQGTTPAIRSHQTELQQLLLNQERALSQMSDSQLLELLLPQRQFRNQAAASTSEGLSASLPSIPQGPMPHTPLHVFNERFNVMNYPPSSASSLHLPPSTPAAAPLPPSAASVDPQMAVFLQALEQQRQQQHQQQRRQQQQPPPPQDPTNHPFFRRSF